jgi:hypothetical protein
MAGAGPFLDPAGAQAPAVAGRAFALSVSSLSATLVAPTPAGVVGGGAATFPAVQASAPALGVRGVASVAGLRAATEGERPGTVTSAASVDTLSLLSGLIGAGAISSACTATGVDVQGSATVTALTIGGTTLPSDAAPNTAVEVPGLVTGVLNEQVRDSGIGRSGITVRAVHLQVRLTQPGMELLDVIVAESRCSVDTGGPVSPTTAPPTVTPTTRQRGTSSTVGLPTTRPAPVTTTLVPPTTVAPGPEPPESGAGLTQALDVGTTDGRRSGAAGSELTVTGSGFLHCADVVIRFDGQRIGVGHPDSRGAVTRTGLSVPGDTSDGAHAVTASCRAAGRLLQAATTFEVVEASGLHRTALVTSLAQPDQVGTSAKSLVVSAVGALGLLLAIAFPSQLFNSTLDENYDEVRGWFGFHRPHDDEALRHQVLEFIGFVLLGGLLYGLLSPDLAFDRSSAALVLGLSLSLVVVSLGFRIPHMLYVHHRDGEWGRLRVLPGTAIVAVVCVALSRLIGFQPGYLYGLIAGLAIRRQLAAETSGALTAVSAVSVFTLSLAAWFARAPVSSAIAAAGPRPSNWLIALEASLAAIAILGIETVVICLIPLRFVEGSKLAAWSRTAWAVVFGLAAFGFVHILLRPDSGYLAAAGSRATVAILFVAFGILSVGFWAYFRFRPAREPVAA